MTTASGVIPVSILHSVHAAAAVSVVVPTSTKAGNIGRLLEEVFAACGSGPAIEVVVVDDGSTDGTREKVLAWETPPVRLVARDHECGLAGAVRAGAEAAVGGAIVVMDADLSHPPACIPDLARPVLGGDPRPLAAACANARGFSLHAEVRLGINQRHKLESQGRNSPISRRARKVPV